MGFGSSREYTEVLGWVVQKKGNACAHGEPEEIAVRVRSSRGEWLRWKTLVEQGVAGERSESDGNDGGLVMAWVWDSRTVMHTEISFHGMTSKNPGDDTNGHLY